VESLSALWLLQECLKAVATNRELIILKDGEAALKFIEEETASPDIIRNSFYRILSMPFQGHRFISGWLPRRGGQKEVNLFTFVTEEIFTVHLHSGRWE
jgi:hypothetical protein